MTNVEKYLKDEANIDEFTFQFDEWHFKNSDVIGYGEALFRFLQEEAKPALTEDERVILRNIVYDSEYKYIYRSLGMLYLSENEKLTCLDRLPAMHHLFQFIKERRRI